MFVKEERREIDRRTKHWKNISHRQWRKEGEDES